MINYIGCLAAFALSLLLSNVEWISSKTAKIITILGWGIALYVAQGGIK